MRRVTGFVGLLLLVAACGGDSATSTTLAATTTTAAAATTTTTAVGTTTPPATGPAAFIAGAEPFLGEYQGEWNNTTFGSSGSVYLNVLEVNVEAGYILVQVDLGGNVFGASDPDLFVVEIFAGGDSLEISDTAFLGAETIEVGDDGRITVTAQPASLGLELTIEGAVVEAPGGGQGFEGTYTIPGLAEGTFNAFPIG